MGRTIDGIKTRYLLEGNLHKHVCAMGGEPVQPMTVESSADESSYASGEKLSKVTATGVGQRRTVMADTGAEAGMMNGLASG